MTDSPSIYPTTSDISIFMREILWYKWSYEAQVFYEDKTMLSFQTIDWKTAELIYKKIVWDKPIESILNAFNWIA